MFTLTGSGIRNILFDVRLRNPGQLPAQLTFCPAPCQKACLYIALVNSSGNHKPVIWSAP